MDWSRHERWQMNRWLWWWWKYKWNRVEGPQSSTMVTCKYGLNFAKSKCASSYLYGVSREQWRDYRQLCTCGRWLYRRWAVYVELCSMKFIYILCPLWLAMRLACRLWLETGFADVHSHYCCQIGYPTPHTAGSDDTSGQKGSFRLYLSHQHSRNLSNNVWNIWSCQDLRLLHSHRPLKILIGDFGGNTHFPAGKYLTSPRTRRGRPGRDTVFVLYGAVH